MVNLILSPLEKGSIRNSECCQVCENGSEHVFQAYRGANWIGID
ncbi:MAG TPA: hypothetical protein VLA74_03380 [Nitrososphaeraceae archaeon]|nr:hypothetical protein [Nitrososphaeraceae archaeon]